MKATARFRLEKGSNQAFRDQSAACRRKAAGRYDRRRAVRLTARAVHGQGRHRVTTGALRSAATIRETADLYVLNTIIFSSVIACIVAGMPPTP
jgi:hypothetical protein